jgi:hypothetical protein
MSLIEGGSPAGNKIVELSDQDMQEVKRLSDLGSNITEYDLASHQRRVDLGRGNQSKAAQYEDYRSRLDYAMSSSDPRIQTELERANKGLAQLNSYRYKDIPHATVHQNATLSNMSVMYANEEYIGEQLAPPLVVGKQSDVYYIYGQNDRLAYPDDELGPRGQANEVQESRTTDSYLTRPYGYQNFVSAMTLANQDAPLNEMIDLTEAVNEGIAFRRELRLATLLTTSANYGTNTAAIAAGNRWDTASGGNPIADLQNARKSLWSGRGPGEVKGFTSLDVFLQLSRHPGILELFKFNGNSPGLATPDMLARWFDMSTLLVGKARQDTAVEGQTPSYSRVWSNVFGMVRVARRPSIRNASFAMTFRHGNPLSTQWFDQTIGHGGGFFSKVSVSEQHKGIAADTGYLLTTVIG